MIKCRLNSHPFPELPKNAKRMGNGFTLWLGRRFACLLGWRIEGEFPNEKQLVIAAAPHTSNWDFVLAMVMVMALGIRVSYLMKKEAFFWPFKNFFMWLGGIPLDRDASTGIVDQIAEWYSKHEHLWVVITPEGTRSKVDRWKTGFLRIAEKVQVPVLLVAWDYPNKTIHLEKLWKVTGEHEKDVVSIRNYLCSRYQGRYPENQ